MFLADEDSPRPVLSELLAQGFDVRPVTDFLPPGSDDALVLAKSLELGRVLITRDLGFGERIIRNGESAIGVVILRLRGPGGWTARAARVAAALKGLGDQAHGQVSIIEWDAVRSRRLPSAS